MHLLSGVVQFLQDLVPADRAFSNAAAREVCAAEPVPAKHKIPMSENETLRETASKGAMGVFVGLAILAAGIWAGRQLHIVWNIWPSTDGVVVSGSVEELLAAPSAKGEPMIHQYKPQVKFRYTVNNQPYTTEVASEYTSDTYQKAAANLLSLYAAGSHHPIRYNPRDPRDIRFGVIELGPLAFAFFLIIAGAVLMVGGANSLVTVYSQRLRRVPAAVEREVPATVLPFESAARVEPAAVVLRCPACGRQVEPGEDTCPNCLSSLRAA